mmetsp:Transcript_20302/g.30096  ORF Transcript_20302/g.30096 Transcript_20302/m.30096 type:complete len:240 (+) Transcript_20302:65-784(+)
MKLSSSLLLAVSVNVAAAAVHTGPHPGAHHRSVGMSLVEEVHQKSSKGKKHHNGNGGKHDSGVDGHHPGYSKSSKGKAHKSSKSNKSSKAKPIKDHSLSMHTSSKATKETSSSPIPTTVAPINPFEGFDIMEIPVITPGTTQSTPIPETPIPETLPTTPEGADTSVLKVIEKDGGTNVILTGGNGSHQSKISDENSVNLQGQEQASMLSETKNSGSIAWKSSVIVGGVCLFAAASYIIV